MRLIRLTTNYHSYLKQFYAQHPQFRKRSYREQYRILMSDCYGWADFWTHALKTLGYEVCEPVGNAEPMQKTWAQEHGLMYSQKTWLPDIVTAQVKNFQPDIVFVNDYHTYTADFLRQLRQECPSIRQIIGWCGAPYSDASVFSEYDLVLSNIPGLVEHFREEGHRCEHMHHAFEPRILEKINRQSQEVTTFSFLGSIKKVPDFHNEREQLLKQLVRNTDLQIWSEALLHYQRELSRLPFKKGVYDLAHTIKFLPGGSSLLSIIPKVKNYARMIRRPDSSELIAPEIAVHAHPPLFGLAMYQKLSESNISLNTHIDISRQYASNMRLYETTGVGTCLLTEQQADLRTLFEPDVEVVTYQHVEEAIEKVQYLLNHHDERRKIAQAGQQRTLRDHNFELRAQQLDSLIQKAIS